MFGIRRVAMIDGGQGVYSSGITDLDIVSVGGVARLVAVTRIGGGLSTYALGSPAGPSLVSQQSWASGVGHLAVPNAMSLRLGGIDLLLPGGVTGGFADARTLNPSGEIGAPYRFAATRPLPPDLAALAAQPLDEGALLYGSEPGSGRILAYALSADGEFSALPTGPEQDVIATLSHVEKDGVGFVLAGSVAGSSLAVHRIGADGTLTLAARMSTESGVGFAGIGTLDTATVQGITYVIAAGIESSSLTVFRLDADGSLSAIDHVVDSLDTRFAATAVVETVTVGDRVFVLAAGSDDGITLFVLLPGGALIHLATLADAVDTTLDNVSALAAMVVAGTLRIHVASASEPGLTELAVDLGPIGLTTIGGAGVVSGGSAADLLVAGPTTTELSGAGGSDILVNAGHAVRLSGGAGGDLFVLSAVEGTVRIVDFDPTQDRLDLTLFPMLRGMDQMTLLPTATGIRLVIRATVIEITSADARPLGVADFAQSGWLSLSRYTPWQEPPPYEVLTGTPGADDLILTRAGSIEALAGNDTLRGSGGDDTLMGGGGRDTINAGEGADSVTGGDDGDRIVGEGGSDALHGEAGDDSLSGDGGADALFGGTGNDTLDGGAEGDILAGGFGFDTLLGGDGDDRLLGEGQADLLMGGAGNDTLIGDQGFDVVSGGSGNDTLSGGTEEDWMFGGIDNDTVDGGAGNDFLFGGLGFDTIFGGDGNDQLNGEGQADALYGDAGADTLFAGQGFDIVSGGSGNDQLFGGTDEDWMFGGIDDDLVDGGAGGDFVYGGLGHDSLAGGDGNDRLIGEGGNDRLDGGAGNDALTGGDGADVFVFGPLSGADGITDFDPLMQGERIDLSTITEITSYADLMAQHASEEGTDTVIRWGAAQSVTLIGVSPGELQAYHFLF